MGMFWSTICVHSLRCPILRQAGSILFLFAGWHFTPLWGSFYGCFQGVLKEGFNVATKGEYQFPHLTLPTFHMQNISINLSSKIAECYHTESKTKWPLFSKVTFYIFFHENVLNSNQIFSQCVSEEWTYCQEITIPSSNTLSTNSQQAITRTNAIKVSGAIWCHWSQMHMTFTGKCCLQF